MSGPEVPNRMLQGEKKGLSEALLLMIQAFQKQTLPYYGMGSFAPLNVVQKESTQLHLSIIAYSTIAICKFFISVFSLLCSEILYKCPEFKVSCFLKKQQNVTF